MDPHTLLPPETDAQGPCWIAGVSKHHALQDGAQSARAPRHALARMLVVVCLLSSPKLRGVAHERAGWLAFCGGTLFCCCAVLCTEYSYERVTLPRSTTAGSHSFSREKNHRPILQFQGRAAVEIRSNGACGSALVSIGSVPISRVQLRTAGLPLPGAAFPPLSHLCLSSEILSRKACFFEKPVSEGSCLQLARSNESAVHGRRCFWRARNGEMAMGTACSVPRLALLLCSLQLGHQLPSFCLARSSEPAADPTRSSRAPIPSSTTAVQPGARTTPAQMEAGMTCRHCSVARATMDGMSLRSHRPGEQLLICSGRIQNGDMSSGGNSERWKNANSPLHPCPSHAHATTIHGPVMDDPTPSHAGDRFGDP